MVARSLVHILSTALSASPCVLVVVHGCVGVWYIPSDIHRQTTTWDTSHSFHPPKQTEPSAYPEPHWPAECIGCKAVGVYAILIQVANVDLHAAKVLGSDELVCP